MTVTGDAAPNLYCLLLSNNFFPFSRAENTDDFYVGWYPNGLGMLWVQVFIQVYTELPERSDMSSRFCRSIVKRVQESLDFPICLDSADGFEYYYGWHLQQIRASPSIFNPKPGFTSQPPPQGWFSWRGFGWVWRNGIQKHRNARVHEIEGRKSSARKFNLIFMCAESLEEWVCLNSKR